MCREMRRVLDDPEAAADGGRHEELVCGGCKSNRFCVSKAKKLVPTGFTYYDIGLAEALKALFTSKKFCDAFATGMESVPYFSSKEYHRLCRWFW